MQVYSQIIWGRFFSTLKLVTDCVWSENKSANDFGIVVSTTPSRCLAFLRQSEEKDHVFSLWEMQGILLHLSPLYLLWK